MKYMITGGNKGLGLALAQQFGADSYSRSNGHDITKDTDRAWLANKSLEYDVFVNNAFDGPFQESWANFGQVQLLFDVANCWRHNNKKGHIINIGSVGTQIVTAPDPDFETYRVAKQALKSHSLQWTRAFKENRVLFKTTLLTLDRLDTELTRSRASWTGNGQDLADVCAYIDLITASAANTCVEEIVSWVNFDHKQ